MSIESNFYSSNRTVLGKAIPIDTPYRLAISISEVCNFKCIYCFRHVSDTISNGYTTLPFMDRGLFERIVEQAKAFPSKIKKVFLNITGEPLCHKELPEFATHAKRELPESIICIQTNGALLTPVLSERIAESGLDDMLISLQGVSAEKYLEISGVKIDYAKFVDNIKYLYSIKKTLNLYVKIPDITLNAGEEKKYFEIFDSISDQATIEKINPVFKEVDYSKMGIDSNSTANRLGSDYGQQRICSIPYYNLSLTTNGNVYPCVQSLIPCTYGNVNNESLADIWNGKTRKDFLITMLRNESIPRCDTCTSKHSCVLSQEDIIEPYADEALARMEKEDNGCLKY